MTRRLTRAATVATKALGSLPAVLLSGLVVVAWIAGGFPGHRWLDNTYQLVINTFTTIVTFWMVFVIQNTQNRSDTALHTKIDAQSKAIARLLHDVGIDEPELLEELVGVEDLPERDIEHEQRRVRGNL